MLSRYPLPDPIPIHFLDFEEMTPPAGAELLCGGAWTLLHCS